MAELLDDVVVYSDSWDDHLNYVKTCLVCQLDKSERTKDAILLLPFPIPEGPWQLVSTYFILGFPKVCTKEHEEDLFIKNVIKYFGVPQDIVTDRGFFFIGRF